MEIAIGNGVWGKIRDAVFEHLRGIVPKRCVDVLDLWWGRCWIDWFGSGHSRVRTSCLMTGSGKNDGGKKGK